MRDRVLLNVRRFRQKSSECGIASVSSLANYYNPDVEYKDVREMISCRLRRAGIWTSQQARLLNTLGFSKVSIVTADLDMIDFSWRHLRKVTMINKLKRKAFHYSKIGDKDSKEWVDDMVSWLSDPECDNRLIVDFDFAKYIRKNLSVRRPIGASVVWTSLFRMPKENKGFIDDIRGEPEYHAFVIRGCDRAGVFIVDSNGYYKRRRRQPGGYYKISWEKFLANVLGGDLVFIS